MIVELTTVRIRPADRARFHTAFTDAAAIYQQARGWHSARLLRCLQDETRYVIEATWEHVEDQTVRFAEDGLLARFLDLVGSLFDGTPELLHFEPVGTDLRRTKTGG
ncbi:antibiotic biosynthesis monooxygenase family protein [Acrocarpospora catenulata]|uniref:antibiotic biosynthesis monooxygenase family protein n=1 Tax=Acrocarpospora catenulata TaxID=2836182 RepID=UPI001BDA1DEF|nr:antibiotic biosynthesis monooxygenase [Acrocarpospora catenulata]